MNSYNINQYKQNHIGTASKEQILIMLYDGAIRFSKLAISGIRNNTPSDKARGISKAVAIISEFANSLDHSIGGKIAEDLDALYGFMIRELSSANAENNISKIETVLQLLVELRQTWAEAIEIQKREESVPLAAVAGGEYKSFAVMR